MPYGLGSTRQEAEAGLNEMLFLCLMVKQTLEAEAEQTLEAEQSRAVA
jgi:hypothetical protein